MNDMKNLLEPTSHADMVEVVDTSDLGSDSKEYGFKSHYPHYKDRVVAGKELVALC